MGAPEQASGIVGFAQAVAAPLTRAAIFLVVTLKPGSEHRTTVRSLCGDLATVVRAVEFRDIEAGLSCVVGFGSDAWDRLFGAPRPVELHVFREIRAGTRHAVSTPGDLLFHIRAKRMDLCFELATQIMARIGRRCFAGRRSARVSLLRRPRSHRFCRRNREPDGAGRDGRHARRRGGCGVCRRELRHRTEISSRLGGWNALPTEEQERIIGRNKLSDIETR